MEDYKNLGYLKVKLNEAKLDDGSIVSYNLCKKEETFDGFNKEYPESEFLGRGVIYSVGGTVQKSQKERYVFFRKIY